MDTTELRVPTGDQLVTDLTAAVTDFCGGRGDGLLNVFVPHATAGLAIIEIGSGTEMDLSAFVDDLLPAEDRYRHRHGTRGHGRDHVLPALVSPSVTVPVVADRPALGTWQSIVLVDTNVDNRVRQVRLSFLAG
ncbi:MAG: YjbQ family protein [Actinomycetes bacterium]